MLFDILLFPLKVAFGLIRFVFEVISGGVSLVFGLVRFGVSVALVGALIFLIVSVVRAHRTGAKLL